MFVLIDKERERKRSILGGQLYSYPIGIEDDLRKVVLNAIINWARW